MHWCVRKAVAYVPRILAPLKPFLERLCKIEARLAAMWARSAHRRLMLAQWSLPPKPESFDHQIDLFYWWTKSRNPQWLERGVYGALCLKRERVLELCCGDGFNARNFYSLTSKRVIACDYDPKILKTARRKNSAENVTFVQADIRYNLPDGEFENIVWDAAIEHLTEDEINKILKSIKDRLTPDGVLSGYTVAQKEDRGKYFSHHEYEFKSKEDLLRFFTPHFKNVIAFETTYPGRHNPYFWASDGVIPFSPSWEHACIRFSDESSTASHQCER